MVDTDREWPAGISGRIGAAIRATRDVQNISAVKLAARTAELGYPIHRVAISRLESGERAISMPELIILAAALNTVPLALLLPGTPDEKIEVLPDCVMTSAATIGWFTGASSVNPTGVMRDPSVISRLDLTMKLNQVDELLRIQRHNLRQAELSLESLSMTDAFRKYQQETVKRTRDLVESLAEQRDAMLYMFAQNGDHDGG